MSYQLKTAGRSGCGLSASVWIGGVSVLATATLLVGQVPDTLLHSLSNPVPNSASFGHSVAVSGSRVVIGGWDFSSPEGYTYVYDLTSATPDVPVLTLTYADRQTGDRFGESVAIAGSRVAVGCPGNGQGANYAGKVFLYDLASLTPDVPVIWSRRSKYSLKVAL
jgi:hypothetical protein